MTTLKTSNLRSMLVLALGILLSSAALWLSEGSAGASEGNSPAVASYESVQDRTEVLDLDTQIFLHRHGLGAMNAQGSR